MKYWGIDRTQLVDLLDKIEDTVGPGCKDAGAAVLEVRRLLCLDENTGERKGEEDE
mgnify:FL=1